MRATLALSALLALSGAGGCAASRPYLGDVSMRSYTNLSGSPTTFGVEQGRIVAGGLDITIDPQGCARGFVGSASVLVCPEQLSPDPAHPRSHSARWSGDGGDFVTVLSPSGRVLRVDGYLRIRHPAPLHVTLLLGKGPQWDELRAHPALYAIAACAVGVSGEPDKSERQEALEAAE